MSKPAEKVETAEKEKKNKKVKPVDKSKYEGAGQSFKAKLIGIEDVAEAKGEKMCQVAIAKLKAAVLVMGEHKEKIVLNLNLDGISLYDEKKEVLLHRHELSVISYVARDIGDSRTFAYVINDDTGKHRCVAIKTEKSADMPVSCLKELFQALDDRRLKSEDGVDGSVSESTTVDVPSPAVVVNSSPQMVANSNNLLGLDNDFIGLQLDKPALVQAPQQKVDLSALLLDDVFGAPEQKVASPRLVSPRASLGMNLMASPLGSPYKPAVVPHYQQLLTNQFSTGMENSFSPISNSSYTQPAHALTQPSPFKPNLVEAQNGWTAFEQLQAPVAASNSALPVDLTSQLMGGPQQFQGASQQFQGAMAAASGAPQPMSPVGSATQQLNPSDPFADLAFLSNLQSQPARKPITREDFVKDPPKITLMDLVGQKRDPFGFPSAQGHHQGPQSGPVSFDSVDDCSETSEDQTARNAGDYQPRPLESASLYLSPESVCQTPATTSVQTPVPQMRMNHLDRLRSSSRPMSIDFTSQRFSVFEDKRGLAGPTEINWFNNNQTEAPKPSPAPRARQRFNNY